MSGRSWPVEVVDFGALIGRKIPPGEPTQATLTRKDGEPSGWIVNCPQCGELGHCDLSGNPGEGHRQTSGEGEPLILEPSVLCRCGGHYWLREGVLTEV